MLLNERKKIINKKNINQRRYKPENITERRTRGVRIDYAKLNSDK